MYVGFENEEKSAKPLEPRGAFSPGWKAWMH